MKAPQPYQAFVPIDLEPMFFAAIDKSRNLQVMLAVRAMFWLGLRESEALEMRWEGLSWDLMRYTPGSAPFDPTKRGQAQGPAAPSGSRGSPPTGSGPA